ncbi:MAG: Hint domain-containing protein [Paracoccus sp. (in: a-proteobacteria)]|uniref:Hint domain-containing protein n=1 Tax=Paracoccus sp. TaxID=267 RepID=UPI0026DFE948|nr:Hint domain-containing protein [Paracoccus sp. (in: a-proteobacteria)]MDO5632512.1 Hint domain-containing protein [Paracoccus sp. (in: a-proteobacteria)]
MAEYTVFYIPLSELSITNPTGPFGGSSGKLFPDADIANSLAANAVNRGRFVWGGQGGYALRVSDDDGNFNDDSDSGQRIATSAEGFPAGTPVELQYGYIMDGSDGSELTIYTVAFNNLNGGNQTVYGIVANKEIVPGVTYTVRPSGYYHIVNPSYDSIYCFTAGVMIDTPQGPVRVESLNVGDLVLTRDHGAQPLRWIGRRRLGGAELAAAPNLRPIRIAAGAIAPGVPDADLVVSPQHRVLVRSQIAQRMFGTNEVLVAAKQLCALDGIDCADDLPEVEYIHLLFDRHEVVISNGAETESLYTGAEAMRAVGPAAQAEIFTLFPELRHRDDALPAARVLVPGRMGRKLASRHAQNRRPLICA